MTTIAFSVGLFLAAFLIHWCWWRIRAPRRQIITLVFLFLGFLPVGIAGGCLLPALRPYAPADLWQGLYVCLFHVAMSLAYIVTFSAMEDDSPTLAIIVDVANAGTEGRSRADLFRLISNQDVIGRRFDHMVAGGLVAATGETYTLTGKGRAWANLFFVFRRLYRLQKGG